MRVTVGLMLWVLDFFPALKAAMPDRLSLIVAREIMLAAVGIVASFALFLISDFVISPFTFVPLCFVLVWLASAFGFNTQKRWAWNLGMATAILSLLVSPFLLGPFVRIMLIPWLVVWPSSIYYLTRPHVKGFLGKTKGPDGGAPNPSELNSSE